MDKILIIEDDEEIAGIEKDYLEINNMEVTVCLDAISGIEAAGREHFDLIILDLMLPGMDGFSACKKLRAKLDIPLIIVSARHESADQVLGLGLGADNFIAKPFDPNVLVAMIKANLAAYKRAHVQPEKEEQILRCGSFELNTKSMKLTRNGLPIDLKNKEYELLEFFLRNHDVVFTKEQLYEKIWGMDAGGDTTTVAVHVNRLRQKIEENPAKPEYLVTVWSVGYRFCIPEK